MWGNSNHQALVLDPLENNNRYFFSHEINIYNRNTIYWDEETRRRQPEVNKSNIRDFFWPWPLVFRKHCKVQLCNMISKVHLMTSF